MKLILYGLLILNTFFTMNLIEIERFVIISFLFSALYICITKLWKNKIFNIYMLLLCVITWFEPNLIFLFLNLMILVFLLLMLFRTENKNFYINITLLNIFFLSISFLIFKYFLLRECIALTDFLAFNLDCDTSKIAVEVTLKNTYTPYPEGQYKIFLSKTGFKEQLRFLTLDWYHFPINMVLYLQLLCLFTDYLPFIDITLIVY